jgi:hypothetical protein
MVLMAVVAWMNYRFTSRLGATEMDGQIFGIGSVAVDVMLALISPLMAWGLKEGRRFYASGAAGIVLLFGILSFNSALGFAAEGRDGAASKRETGRLAVRATQQKLEGLQGTRKGLGQPRPTLVVEAELNSMRADRRWAASRNCTAAKREDVGYWCQAAHKLVAEQAAAKESMRLDREIDTATRDLAAARERLAGC